MTGDAPDMDPVPAAALIALPPEAWETLAFTALPSLRRVTLAFDVPWDARARPPAPPFVPLPGGPTTLSKGPRIWPHFS
jgi:hypothetical protein